MDYSWQLDTLGILEGVWRGKRREGERLGVKLGRATSAHGWCQQQTLQGTRMGAGCGIPEEGGRGLNCNGM